MCIGKIRGIPDLLLKLSGICRRVLRQGIFNGHIPQRINVGPLTSFGYEHEVLLLVPVTVDAEFSIIPKM